jgi:hypothetical protein
MDPSAIIAMNHFSQQPEIWPNPAAPDRQFPEKIHVNAIRRIQPQPVDIEFADPEGDGFKKLALNLGMADAQFDQMMVPPESKRVNSSELSPGS